MRPADKVLLLLVLALPGCDDPGPAWSITPGVGVRVDGVDVRLGDTLPTRLEELAGEPPVERDMDRIGTLVSFPSLHVDATVRETEVTSISLEPGFAGTTSDGVGLGSEEADVRRAFGEPVPAPFTGHWWYHGRGIGFERSDGRVERVFVVAAAR
jgi:hypothetical protein